MIYRRDLGSKVLAIPLLILVGLCVFGTQSKGAYLSAAACIAAGLLVGRSPLVQIIIAAGLILAGSAVTSMLPRMADSEAMRHDEGVMGRALAFEAGRTAYRTGTTGWNRFEAQIRWEGELVSKSTHSSIVQIGADLGPTGLFLYMSIMACAARSLLTLKTDSERLERVRGLLFSLLVGYFVSGWMINRSYHAEFFLIAGAVTAFHKLAHERLREMAGLPPEGESSSDTDAEDTEPVPLLTVVPSDAGDTAKIEVSTSSPDRWKRWNRYGIVDLAIAYTLLSFVLWFWDYLIEYFIPSN